MAQSNNRKKQENSQTTPTIDNLEVARIANLARLNITEQELEKYLLPLLRIFESGAQMNDINTQNVTPTDHPLDITQRLRPDKSLNTTSYEILQRLAPSTLTGLYLVPQVIN